MEDLEITSTTSDEDETTDLSSTSTKKRSVSNLAVTNIKDGQRVGRKYLLTVVEWDNTDNGGEANARQILGQRVEDSSIEFNPDIETTTDILGNNYTDVNKTQPQQDLDASFIKGSAFYEYLVKNALENNNSAYNGTFDVYIISAYLGDSTSSYHAVKHANCTITISNIGGSDWLDTSISVYFSNDLTVGTVDALNDTFKFTAKTSE